MEAKGINTFTTIDITFTDRVSIPTDADSTPTYDFE
jgi:hypothetical protein